MEPDEDLESRRLAAHHEAGHTLAALRRDRDVYEIYINWEHGLTSFEETDGEIFEFIVYAGPWAQAHAQWDEQSINDEKVADAFGTNPCDWIAYETEKGGDVQAVRDFLYEEGKASLTSRDPSPSPRPL